MKDKSQTLKDKKMPAFKYTQNLVAAIPEIRDAHGCLWATLMQHSEKWESFLNCFQFMKQGMKFEERLILHTQIKIGNLFSQGIIQYQVSKKFNRGYC